MILGPIQLIVNTSFGSLLVITFSCPSSPSHKNCTSSISTSNCVPVTVTEAVCWQPLTSVAVTTNTFGPDKPSNSKVSSLPNITPSNVHSYSRLSLLDATVKTASSPQSVSKSAGTVKAMLSGTNISTSLTVLQGILPAVSVMVTE